MNRRGSRCSLMALTALLLLGAAGCFHVGQTTAVTVGVGLPAPWGSVTIGTAVPLGYGW